MRVIDGDTIEADLHLGFGHILAGQRLRLLGIDAPELRGEEKEEGEATKAWLIGRLEGCKLTVRAFEGDDHDSFRRWVATLYADAEYVCHEMVVEGMAEVDTP